MPTPTDTLHSILNADADSTPTPRDPSQPLPRLSDSLPIFDGENTPQNISTYGFLLGAIFGGSIIFVAYERELPQLGIYLAALSLFHTLEYVATALFNRDKLTLDSYLINHSDHYHIANAATLLEFLIERYFFPEWKTFGIANLMGFLVVIIGQSARTIAMFSAKENFSHHIADHKERDHRLVTNGIYSIMRHPSYFGFYWWALGVQVLLLNPICFVGFIKVLYGFFSERIEYEEYTLTKFFGLEYVEYRKRTRTYIPFIN
ncbi:farnesyl cysteine-carboxyl methyltransferase, mediates the carboxyl methylation step during C-termin [Jimgerdemannia flammicorona]|uniref:Protein-S-isoprenylcysteine O-methyltransferase n=1 Tax=Jimgerdemannia flammicorona TaxID=994334 RepID=A0A433QAI4_9FUNG|nr:farnesyl cysteine-carboxyl methyltransferase, mediates the carboxyl methylation step during C-termin [Jimgerdemannia flammicorona]